MLRRLLLLPVLAPLLAALAVAAVNPRPAVTLRILIWRTPPLPLGLWIAAAAATGAALSGSAAALALREASPELQRRVRRPAARFDPRQPASSFEPDSPLRRETPFRPEPFSPPAAGPERAPGEPAPTVSVPFRVLRRSAGPAREPIVQEVAQPVPAGEGWEAEALEDW